MTQKIIVLGALSDIAEAAARQYAKDGAELVIAGRNAGKLDTAAADLRVRGAAN